MSKLLLTPSQSGYAVEDGAETLWAPLSGGPARFRRDFTGAAARVNANWNLPPDEFTYIRAFYRTATEMGSEPFDIDLIIDGFELLEYEARFIPGSMRITGANGTMTSVSAQMEVRPRPVDTESDEAIIMLYELYSAEGALLLETLEELVNVDMPTSFPG